MKNDFIDNEDMELLNSVATIVKPSKPVKTPTKPIETKVPSTTLNNQEKRKARRKQTAEDFTPKFLVDDMLNKLPEEVWEANKTFVDPACGNGNFLIEVLRRKLKAGHDPVEAIKTVYGTDIMEDNVKEARLRLLKVIVTYIKDNKLPKPNQIEIVKALIKNIVCTPLSKYPNGSLDYDFEFSYTPNDLQAKQCIEKIAREKLLDQVSI